MNKMTTYLIIALIGIVLFGIGAIVMRMNMTTISEVKKVYIDTIDSNTPFLGIETIQSITTGNNNVVIGLNKMSTNYKVDTVLYCKKCNKKHHAYFAAYNENNMIYKAKCETEFDVKPKKIK